jgi:hypothetical protein
MAELPIARDGKGPVRVLVKVSVLLSPAVHSSVGMWCGARFKLRVCC